MKKLLLLITICLAFGCQKNNPQEQLKNINGYWEISEVEASGKLVKKYGFNSAVDFFEIEEKNSYFDANFWLIKMNYNLNLILT